MIFGNALAVPRIHQRSLSGLASSVQLKIKMFLGTSLLVDEPIPEVERRFIYREERIMPQNQLNSANHVVLVFAGNF